MYWCRYGYTSVTTSSNHCNIHSTINYKCDNDSNNGTNLVLSIIIQIRTIKLVRVIVTATVIEIVVMTMILTVLLLGLVAVVALNLILVKRMKVVIVVLAALIPVLVRTTIICSSKLNIDTNHNNSNNCSNTTTIATIQTNI